MAKISGRSDDMLIVRGVNVFPSQIEELILRCKGLAPHYEIEITRPNRLDEITIVVEARADTQLRGSHRMRDRRRAVADFLNHDATLRKFTR
jgi:phenylacetate-CoA ligase